MAKEIAFTKNELRFLRELNRHRIPCLIVGVAAAVLQGAPVGTQDVDLWFRCIGDPRIAEILKKTGGIYVPSFPQFQNPPHIAGEDFHLFDIVVNASGLADFDTEYRNAVEITVAGIKLKVLPLHRVIASKKAAGRPKDKMALPALEAALAALKARRRKKKARKTSR